MLLAFVALPARSVAQPPSPDDQAQRHHERATVYYNLGQFEEAIVEYRKGYEQKAHPVFLFNIAEAYRQLGAHDKALFFYRRYLSAQPEADNRRAVEERIAELEPLVPPESRSRAAAAPAPLVVPPAVPAPRIELSGDPGEPARPPSPAWRSWWLWAGVGVAVVGGVAVALALGSTGRGGLPPTELGSQRFF